MAISKAAFDTAIWSDEILKKFQDSFITQAMRGVPKRTKGAQLLRDAALGHPEFAPAGESDNWPVTWQTNTMTATEMRIRHEQANHAAAAMARSFDNDMLDSLRYQFPKDVKK